VKPSDPVRPAPYSTAGEPFFDERGTLHLIRYHDVPEVTRRERRGQFSAALSVVRRALARHGMTVPDPVHLAWLFPWVQGTVEADGSPGRHAVLHGVLAEYLGKQAVRDLRPAMVVIANRLVRENVERERANGGTVGTIDLARFTDLLAFRSISALIGLPPTPDAEAFMMSHIEELLGRIIAAHRTGQITLDERDALMWGCWSAGRDTSATLTALLFGLVDEIGAMSTMVAGLDADGTDWRERGVPRQNLVFGHGMHYCLGAPIALAEADIAAVAVYGGLPDLTVTRWHRLAHLTDAVDIAEAEYDLPAAVRALGLAA
jgi:cytochrome P450